ncbi:MAG TPA: alpha/beta fold hydrolase [Noviherbaspirillum sp.]|uniref:alpha/beta fold hydrolase n=1 Tax=Noviherbaspirillum sp. TaxID=1926288 RepID=UPI002D43B8F2|nr:alpha/beta fold hydrolase [Noviherbaspirillum sp.]HYD96565.1 alpha/beta fold hydrolase [Noviherbaspirillum sp.]
MTIPTTQYAKSGAHRIAYQVIGKGPIDIVLVPGFVSNVDLQWEHSGFQRLLENIASFARLVVFDKRGTGLSDRVPSNALPTLEARMDDVRAVMDAAGMKSAALIGVSEGGPMSMLFAATYPHRTRALVLYGTYSRFHPDVLDRTGLASYLEAMENGWGTGASLRYFAPSLSDDERMVGWWARYERHSASPTAAVSLVRMNAEINVGDLLASIRVPTLILHRRDDTRVSASSGRRLAESIGGARYVELEGRDHLFFAGDVDALTSEIQEFVTGNRPASSDKTVLVTVMAAAIKDPVAMAIKWGDAEWERKLADLRQRAGSAISSNRGVPFFSSNEEIYGWFDGPARAVQCAATLLQDAAEHGVPLACGVHIGEAEKRGDKVSGVTVQLARQLALSATTPQVLVTGVVRDLTVGAGLSYTDSRTTLELDNRQIPVFTAGSAGPAASGTEELRTKFASLSAREKEVLTLISLGLTNAMIADRLHLSEHTVKRHVANILLKLDLSNRAAAAAVMSMLGA